MRFFWGGMSCEAARCAMEAIVEDDHLDHGALKFHLERCEACTALAPELLFLLQARPSDGDQVEPFLAFKMKRNFISRQQTRRLGGIAAAMILLCGLWAVSQSVPPSTNQSVDKSHQMKGQRPATVQASFALTSRLTFDGDRRVESQVTRNVVPDPHRLPRRAMEWKSR